MSDLYALRRAFMRQFDIAAPQAPQFDLEAMAMWRTMLSEEWQEFQQALHAYQNLNASNHEEATLRMAELCAEGVDVLNVLCGLLLSQGLPLEAMTQAIHEANLRKIENGRVLRRADGKILKPPHWQPADINGVIRQAVNSSMAD
jgi:predicted HAD superfamily Cof-like phosphohydrolase